MNFDLLVNLYKDSERLGPGSAEHTKKAIELADLKNSSVKLEIADIGCGTGASTLILADNLDANITAVDLFPEFLAVLEDKAQQKGVADKINTLKCSMDDLPFEPGSLDALWSEGAIYIMGFENGISYLNSFLKPGGILALTEITWLTQSRPLEITEYWEKEYPKISTAEEKKSIIERNGFILKNYFFLPEDCWLKNYYLPLEERFDDFLSRYNSDEARSLIDSERNEIEIYRKYGQYYSYGFYIAQKV